MKTKLIIVSIILSVMVAKAQWSKQTSGAGATILNSVKFIGNEGWVVGSGGKIRHTTDGGITWSAQTSGTGSTLNSVYFKTPSKGWAAGLSGTIRYTINGGTTWSAQTSGTVNALNSIQGFVNNSDVFAVGNNATILYSSNSGTSWSVQSNPISSLYDFHGMCFINQNEGWVVGEGSNLGCVILYTDDGGLNWYDQNTQGITGTLYAIDINPLTNEGWAVGEAGLILHNDDATNGQGWNQVVSGVNKNLYSVRFPNSGNTNEGWITGQGGTILHTSNAGAAWSDQSVSTIIYDLFESTFINNGANGWIVGNAGTILNMGGPNSIEKTETNVLGSSVYPSPMHEQATIKYKVEKNDVIKLDLVDVKGSFVETLVDETKPAGEYTELVQKNNLTSGIYFYKLQIGEGIEIKKIVIE